MGLFDIFTKVKTVKDKTTGKQNFASPLAVEPLQPLSSAIVSKQKGDENYILDINNDLYNRMDTLAAKDDRLATNLELTGTMCANSYKGLYIDNAADEDETIQIDDEEKNMLKYGYEFLNRINVTEFYRQYSQMLIKYGDIVLNISHDVKYLDEFLEEELETPDQITALLPLAMNNLTIIDDQSRIEEPETERAIEEANFFVINEEDEESRVVYDKSEIIHISFKNKGVWTVDGRGRSLYGVKSYAPLQAVEDLVARKKDQFTTEMMWNKVSIPRAVHKVDNSSASPMNETGIESKRYADAQARTDEIIENYKKALEDNLQSDSQFVVTPNISIEYLEPKGESFKNRSDSTDQIDQKISSVMGIPDALSGGGGGSFSSLEFSATFVGFRTLQMCKILNTALLRALYIEIKARNPGITIQKLRKLQIRSDFTLPRDLTEYAKHVSIMSDTAVFTPNELRKFVGHGELSDNKIKEIKEFLEWKNVQINKDGNSTREGAGKQTNGKQADVNDTSSIGEPTDPGRRVN